jgi:hypothetical protein
MKMDTARQLVLPRGAEFALSIVVGSVVILAYYLHIKWSQPGLTIRETTLFSILEFLLACTFAWYSTRTVSRLEFEASLRRFAIIAYRRIADIREMLDRLGYEINAEQKTPLDRANMLRSIDAIRADIAQIVSSSIADWADMVGPEHLAKEELARLEEQRGELRAQISIDSGNKDTYARLRRVNQQIARLVNVTSAGESQHEDRPNLEEDQRAAEWLTREHHKTGGLFLTIVTGDWYSQERRPELLKENEAIRLVRSNDDPNLIDALDSTGAIVGRLQNYSPLSYEGFARALEMCYGCFPITSLVAAVSKGELREDGHYAWIRVRVAREPAIEM